MFPQFFVIKTLDLDPYPDPHYQKNAGSRSVSGSALKPMRIRNTAQIEGMGLREYQAMLSLRDVLHDGWLCTFTIQYNISSQLGSSCRSNRYFMDGKGRRYGPSITDKITPDGSLSNSQPGGPPCWASPLSFGLIGYTSGRPGLQMKVK